MTHFADKLIPKAVNFLLVFLQKVSFSVFLFASLNSKGWLDHCQGSVLFLKEYLCFKKSCAWHQGGTSSSNTRVSELQAADLLMQASDQPWTRTCNLSRNPVELYCSPVSSLWHAYNFQPFRLHNSHLSCTFSFPFRRFAVPRLVTHYRLKVVFFLSVHFSPLDILLSRCRLLCVSNTFTWDRPNSLILCRL